MKYILILTALLVLIGAHSEASEPIPESAYTLNDTGKYADAGESETAPKTQEITLAKMILTQDKPAQHVPAPASVAEPNTTPGTNSNNEEFPLSSTSAFILVCGLIGMLAIRRNFTP